MQHIADKANIAAGAFFRRQSPSLPPPGPICQLTADSDPTRVDAAPGVPAPRLDLKELEESVWYYFSQGVAQSEYVNCLNFLGRCPTANTMKISPPQKIPTIRYKKLCFIPNF